MPDLPQYSPSVLPDFETAYRVQKVLWQGEPGWLKLPERLSSRMRLQKGNPRRAFEAERETLKRLWGKGLPVPRLLADEPDYFVTSDAGTSLRHLLMFEGAQDPQFKAAFIAAAAALGALHRAGEAHGRPAFRDICWDGQAVTFIDWERPVDPHALAKAQAGDVIHFFFSAFVEGQVPQDQMQAARQAYSLHAPAPVWDKAVQRVRRMRWLAALLGPLIRRLNHKDEFAAVFPFLDFMAR